MPDGGIGVPIDRAPWRDQLVALEAMLDEVVALAETYPIFDGLDDGETVAGQTAASLDDYLYARDLVAALAGRIDDLSIEDAERLDLNADLAQLAFHLDEELIAQRAEGVDPVALKRSLTFLKRHIVRLRAEYEEHVHLHLDPSERSLLVSLAQDTRTTYVRDYAPRYAAIGYRRPYVDKFYRDYSLNGIPDGLLLALDDLASADPEGDGYDLFVGVLKGGLSFITMLRIFGVADHRLRHVMAGRASGSHHEDTYLFRPLDFAVEDLAGRSVLIVENNLATGATLTHLTASLAGGHPRRLGIFMDYILTDLAGIDAANLASSVGYDFDGVHVGPWPSHAVTDADRDRVAGLRLTLAAGLAARAGG